MRIAFVTSCLEPCRDGVGDYTRLLAEECSRRGHLTATIALNDPYLEEVEQSRASLRLPRSMDWKTRAILAKRKLDDFAPDWVSLQFVCYGYERRGFVGSVARHLVKVLEGRALHVFFHELWIGEERGARLKHRIAGWLQKRGVLSLMQRLHPRVVHTSNRAYVELLSQHRIASSRLPLFGALPLPSNRPRIARHNLIFAFFGTLHPVWPAEPLLSYIRALKRPVVLAHAGRIGAGAAVWERMGSRYGSDFGFRRLGELPPQQIADFLADADFGVATTPWALIGKSATVAAMLDSGLPVVVNRDDVRYPGVFEHGEHSPSLIRMDANLPQQLCTVSRALPRLRLPEVGGQFLADLEGAILK